MNKTLIHNLKFFTLSIALGLTVGLGAIAVNATWTNPPIQAPNSNLRAPINTSGIAQIKDGSLDVKGVLRGGSLKINEQMINGSGAGGSALVLKSDHATVNSMIINVKGGQTVGSISGAYNSTGNARHIGFIDGDGNWAYRTQTDTNHVFAIDNKAVAVFGPNSVRFPSLVNCDTIDTDANGNLKCGTDQSGSGNNVLVNTSTCRDVSGGNYDVVRCDYTSGEVMVSVQSTGIGCGGYCVGFTIRCCKLRVQ